MKDKELERSNKEQMHRLKLYRADRYGKFQTQFDWTPNRFRWCKFCIRSRDDFKFHWKYHLMEEIN